MRMLIYAGGEYMTGDEIARSLMELSAVLAEQDASQLVEIPVVGDDGNLAAATFLVGPASQIVAVDAESSLPDLRDAEAVTRLRRLTASLRRVVRTEVSQVPDGWEGSEEL